MEGLITRALVQEYEGIVEEAGKDAEDECLIGALVIEGHWTLSGAAVVVSLARTYGTSVLRNALALAHALGIEDGDSGM